MSRCVSLPIEHRVRTQCNLLQQRRRPQPLQEQRQCTHVATLGMLRRAVHLARIGIGARYASQLPIVQTLPGPGMFYRRPLPDTCTDFSSAGGKTLFSSALTEGGMECYFKLASQFRTQDEPAFCGLSTLVMVLNALSIDPGRAVRADFPHVLRGPPGPHVFLHVLACCCSGRALGAGSMRTW